MKFNYQHYVPCLRWKQGEYQAVLRLQDATKRLFTPLIEIPELGWDFEEQKENKTIDELLNNFALKKVVKKWGSPPCFIDLNLIPSSERMANGEYPVNFIFNEFRINFCTAIPVTGLLRDEKYQEEIKLVSGKDRNGICLRITLEQAASSELKTKIDSLMATLEVQATDCDFILDLGVPNFSPIEGFSKTIKNIATKLPYLNKWRTFTILGTSFPDSMSNIKKGGECIPRYEWQLYKVLISDFQKASLRFPTFGDYAINHPKVLQIDMRKVKPFATIRYTIDNSWYIMKGENVKDKKYGRLKQYRGLCKKVVESKYYCDPTFSWGDSYIKKCANGKSSTGSLMTWRQVGTNRHIEKVIQDIASFYASSGSL